VSPTTASSSALACRPLRAGELPHVSDAAAAVHRRLLRSAHPALHFAPVATPARGAGWWLQLQLGSLPLVLQAPASVWPEWSPAQIGNDMPDALLGAGMAQVAAPLWAALSQVLGAPVQLLSARWLHDAPAAAADALAWRFDRGGPDRGSWCGSLQAPTPPAWAQWATALHEPAPPAQAARPAAISPDRCSGVVNTTLAVPVTIEVGRTRLPVADLARLRRHAVLLIDTAAPPVRGGSALAVRVRAGTGRLPLARALWQAAGGLCRQPGSPAAMGPSPFSLEGNTMSAQAERSSPPPNQATGEAGAEAGADTLDLGPLEVEVRFELARQTWSLGQLSQWKVGEALAFDMALTQATVGAWIHDRCVASGRLVVVGERLGLRIDALQAEPPAPASAGSGEADGCSTSRS
jgi:flagellar motor switch/type III secretory pathway protein FliN